MAKAKDDKPQGVRFRAANRPVFGFRYAAGRGPVGKLMFYSHEDTVIEDPKLVARCRDYCPNYLVEVGPGGGPVE